VVMFPCKRSERFCHFLLGQAHPGALSLETSIRAGLLSPSARVGVSHMATLRHQRLKSRAVKIVAS